jgi:predicted transposase YbfD/YdcC
LLSAKELADAVWAHWSIKNRLHWILDVCFGEDASMVRKGNAPQNLSLLKKMVLSQIRMDMTDKVKTSMRQKRKRAAWMTISGWRCWGSTPYDVRVRQP